MSCLLGYCVYSYPDVFAGFGLGVVVGLALALLGWSASVYLRTRGR